MATHFTKYFQYTTFQYTTIATTHTTQIVITPNNHTYYANRIFYELSLVNTALYQICTFTLTNTHISDSQTFAKNRIFAGENGSFGGSNHSKAALHSSYSFGLSNTDIFTSQTWANPVGFDRNLGDTNDIFNGLSNANTALYQICTFTNAHISDSQIWANHGIYQFSLF